MKILLRTYSIIVLLSFAAYLSAALVAVATGRIEEVNNSDWGGVLAACILVLWLPFWFICRARARALQREGWYWAITFLWPSCLLYIFRVDPIWVGGLEGFKNSDD